MPDQSFLSLFDLLPIGAYRSTVDGRQIRANAALVRMNGYHSEAELLAAVNDIGIEWYVDPTRRALFGALIQRDGQITNFRSEVYRHRSRERMWVLENAHLVHNAQGELLYYEGTVEDVTEQHQAQLALEASEQRFRALTERSQVMTVVCTEAGEVLYASPAARRLLGREPESLRGQAVFDWMLPEDVAHAQAEHASLVAQRNSGQESIYRYRHADGSVRHFATLASNCLAEPAVQGIVLHFRDATESVQAQATLLESEARWKLALDSAGDGVWDWHLPADTILLSARGHDMLGYRAGELTDRASDVDDLVHPDERTAMQRLRKAHLADRTPTFHHEHRMRCGDGSWKWVMVRGMVIERDVQERALRMIGTLTDISQRKNAEALVWQQANFDSLTGLPNRHMLRERLAQEIRRGERDAHQLAVLFIDLDHFKEVNDTLGHDAGDRLLQQAAQRMRGCVRQADTVARLGGDEFAILISPLDDAHPLERVLADVLKAMSTAFAIGQEQVFVSASIGITLHPVDATDVDGLLKSADQALYAAKGAGRNRFSFFTPALQEAALRHVRLANDLRAGLAQRQFHLAYQPIVDLRDGSIRKAEALLRWQHPVRGAVGPAEFIPVAEATGLILELGEWVFTEALRQVQDWRARFHPDFQLSVNRSPVQFQHASGRHRAPEHATMEASESAWADLLQAQGLPGDAIVVEITEGLLLDTNQHVKEQLRELRAAGMRVSLDDFGTGYSSLAYLQQLDIDFLKIDQTFVRNLAPRSTELALCCAIVAMAHALGMQVVAEGVETEQQRDLLREAGCDFGQGYLFSRPVPPEQFDALMVK